MKYLSVCSGIEAATVAWEPLGWRPLGFSEIEPFASAVLAHRYPHVKNFGDMNDNLSWPIQPNEVDVLVGGTPCQSFSVAGLRKGLADPRGNLALVYLGLVDRLRPRWCVWENVPGVLSSGGGRDFGALLGALGDLGYGWAYRVLDAQWFGVAQRRKRVFLVGYAGGWAGAAAVLFERESLRRHPAPSRQAGNQDARGASASARTGRTRMSQAVREVCPAITRKWSKGSAGPSGDEAQNLVLSFNAFGKGENVGTKAVTLCKSNAASIFQETRDDGTANCLRSASGGRAGMGAGAVAALADGEQEYQVRRLTPRECERLQGFPDDYTLIPYRAGKPAADGPRYKALGNSMAVPVMRWIGERIAQVDALAKGGNG